MTATATATAEGYWPVILGPMPAPEAKHFRVIAGPVDKPTRCLSIRDYHERVPDASDEARTEAARFFAEAGRAVLEVVPSSVPV